MVLSPFFFTTNLAVRTAISPYSFTHVSPVSCLSTNVRDGSREVYAMRGVFSTPSPAKQVPSPYKQGESAVRTFLHSARVTHYYLLLTTYYLNSDFLSFFSPFAEKALTNFNILCTCFVNYKGPASAENTHNFSYNTNNFSFSPNIFSDSPSNFSDFPTIFGIKKWRYPELPRYLHYRSTKIINLQAKCKSVNFR